MREPLHSNNLVPFKKRRDGYHLPGGAGDEEEDLIDQVDPDLSPEEQGFVRHYLAYADLFLESVRQEAPSQNGDAVAMPDPMRKDSEDKAA